MSTKSPAKPVAEQSIALTQSEQIQALAASMPFNASKAGEHGARQGLRPPAGQTITPQFGLPTASTLTEENTTEKTGGFAMPGLKRPLNL